MKVPARLRSAFLGVLLFAGWQFLTVQGNYQGNWTALFCTGANFPVPPSLRAGTWVFPHTFGYDGQMYRYVAHDPLFRGDNYRFMDDAILRGRRILVPGLAYVLAVGRQPWIDATYIAVIWLSVFLGCYWCGLAFLLLPATLISLDRLTIDIATCALTAGFVWYWSRKNLKAVYAVVVLACLSRETGGFLLLACVIEALAHRNWRQALIFPTAALPAAAWYAYLWRYGPPATTPTGLPAWLGGHLEFGPLIQELHLFGATSQDKLDLLIKVFDCFALAGMVAGFLVAAIYGMRHWKESPGAAALLFAFSFVTVSGAFFWQDIDGYVRPFSPMLLIPFLSPYPRWKSAAASVCLVIDSRIFLQFGPQLLHLLGVRFR